MDKVILFGNGQNASVAYAYLTHDSPYEVVAFTVDRAHIKDKELFGLPVIPFEDVQSIYPPVTHKMLISVSYAKANKLRAAKYYEAKDKGYQLITYISSKAMTWPGLIVGDNCVVLEHTVIQPFATIGNNVTVSSGSHIGHHTTIKDHCYVAQQVAISGFVTAEPYCFFGANSTIRDGITIARECVIGAGALILNNTRERSVYMARTAQLMPMASDHLPGM